MPLYEAWLGVPYPLAKLDLVAIPDFAAGAMENLGLITFRETDLLVSSMSGVLGQRRVAEVVAHEMAHLVRFLEACVGCMHKGGGIEGGPTRRLVWYVICWAVGGRRG